MKRSVQEIVELLVFGLIALLVGTGLLWLAGWIFDLVGVLFKFFAALIWSLLRFIVPVAVGAAIVYALVRLVQQQRDRSATERSRAPTESPGTTNAPRVAAPDSGSEPAESASTIPSATTPTVESAAERRPDEEESHPRASEIWVPPQPSPPTSSSESLNEPRPVEDARPVEDPWIDAEPVDPQTTAAESTGSVPPEDDEAQKVEPLADTVDEEDGKGDGNDHDDDQRRS